MAPSLLWLLKELRRRDDGLAAANDAIHVLSFLSTAVDVQVDVDGRRARALDGAREQPGGRGGREVGQL